MTRWNLSRPRVLGLGFAVATLTFAACGHGGGSVVPTATPTPIPTASGGVVTSACQTSPYAAYVADGGNGRGFFGLQAIHYADTSQALCASPGSAGLPPTVAFSASVGPLTLSQNDINGIPLALAITGAGAGAYHLAQDIFGLGLGAPVPAGATYDFSVEPPSPTPVPSSSATIAPNVPPLLGDVSSVSILLAASNAASAGVGLVTAPDSSGIVAVTSLTNAPPVYGQTVFYRPTVATGNSITPTVAARSSILAAPDGTSVIARGPADLLLYDVPQPYILNPVAENTGLGSAGVARSGFGNMAYDPADTTKLLVAGTSGGGATQLTLLTGLPTKLTSSSTITVPGSVVNSVAFDSTGAYAYVATDVGIVAVGGVSSDTLAIAKAFTTTSVANASQIPYVDCNGRSTTMTDVYAARVAVTSDQYLVAFGTSPGTTCASGYDAAVVAIPFSPALATVSSPSPAPTSSATASPTKFTQNNVIAPPANADYFVAR